MLALDSIDNALAEIVRRHGTPTYAYDMRRLAAQADKLRQYLPDDVEILYSLKANASLGVCEVLAHYGTGADVASSGELATALAAGFHTERIFVAGPWKLPETVEQLRGLPEAVVSVDSVSELEFLARQALGNRVVLRLRPDFRSSAVVAAGADGRFGVPENQWLGCREIIRATGMNVIGFHVFAGSQVLDAAGIIEHLRGAVSISLRAADALSIAPRILNLGGGFGIPYGAHEGELDLKPIGEQLATMVRSVAPAQIVLELGRYLVAQAGWYLTSVVGHQTHDGRPAVIVDGGTHQRADLCGLGLRTKAAPPLVLGSLSREVLSTDVLGCLSLPADILAQATQLPPLSPGDVLAFANAGAYGLWSSPAIFHGSPLPAEVAFDNKSIELMRPRRTADDVLRDQCHVFQKYATT